MANENEYVALIDDLTEQAEVMVDKANAGKHLTSAQRLGLIQQTTWSMFIGGLMEATRKDEVAAVRIARAVQAALGAAKGA